MSASRVRTALAAAAALGGALAAVGGSPYRTRHAVLDVERVARAVAREEDHVTALELAAWLREGRKGLRVVDVRTAAEFAAYHLPRAERIPLEQLPAIPFAADEAIVLVSDGGAHAAQAWVLLQALGHRRAWFLRGGVSEWLEDVMSPALEPGAPPERVAAFRSASELSRYFGGVPRVLAPGESAARARVRATPPRDEPFSAGRKAEEARSAGSALRRRGC